LVQEWRGINLGYFKSALRLPIIRLVDTRELVRWSVELRSLEISRGMVLEYEWGELLEALKREVVHQFIDERLNIDEERRRGPTFRRTCARLGISSRATGKPGPRRAGDPLDATDRIVSRIHKLLALARSPNQHEAETAALTARRLMLKFNMLDVHGMHGVHGMPDNPERSCYGYRRLGRPTGPLWEHDRRLAKILNTYFFVESAWLPIYLPRTGQRGSVLEICGLEPNLLMAEHVHTFTSRTALRLWSEYMGATHDSRDRLAFLAGVMKGFETKLAAQSQQLEQQGLVWVPAPQLGVYFRRRNPTLQYVQSGDAAGSEAYEQGNRAGRAIVLSGPIASGSSGIAGRPKSLESGQ
jgi:hypothetical protein